jgi:hypothetical protein
VKVTGQIVCTRTLKADAPERLDVMFRPPEDWDVACEWKGGRVAAIHSEILRDADPRHFEQTGKGTYRLCQYRLRVVGERFGIGTPYDLVFVMRDGPLTRVLAYFNRCATWLRGRLIRFDVAAYRLLGRPLKEGTHLPRLSLSYVLVRLWNPQRWEM